MTDRYDHQGIEEKWQQVWEDSGLYHSEVDWSRPKHYAVTMLPYPSGDLHIGHWYAMTPSDARARFMRMSGYNVLFPMGFDAFGLPAENAAVKRNIHPWIWTADNVERMRRQLKSMGAMFDWRREAISSDPSYYRWTQWFFKKFYEAGVAYRGEARVNWSPTLQTVLANEQVIDGKDERTGQPVEQRMMEQWFFAITRYADQLLDYSTIDWPEFGQALQKNWIGRSEGADVVFATEHDDEIEIFTTRPDTLWGATFMVLAPEHPLVDSLTTDQHRESVEIYKAKAASETELERMEGEGEKTGVFTGGCAINPVNGERIPVWIADYVLMSYGSGAIMAVPAHDQRDFEFARKYGLDVVPVIHPDGQDELSGVAMAESYVGPGVMVNSGPIDGIETTVAKGRANPSIAATIDWLEDKGIGAEAVNYRLRDWLISRQRYWGSPIPIRYRQDGVMEPVEDEALPVELPQDVEFMPTGQSPLQLHDGFLNTTDAEGMPATREPDTLDTFMCSSWYYYRYLSPHFEAGPFDPEEAAYWLPVDTYTGGSEHYVMHLMYARFFTKVMRDLGMFDETAQIMRANGRDPAGQFDEPMLQLRNQGQVLGEERSGDRIVAVGEWSDERLIASLVRVDADAPDDAGDVVGEIMRRTENILGVETGDGLVTVEIPDAATIDIPSIPGDNSVNQLRHHLDVQRMSKTRGNVVAPDDLVERYGADTVRGHLMFAYDWEKGGPWDSRGIVGTQRFIQDVWKLCLAGYQAMPELDAGAVVGLRRRVHQTIKKVGADIEGFRFNTAVAALMTLRNDMQDVLRARAVTEAAWDEAKRTLLLLLAPIAPHVTEELWNRLGEMDSIHLQAWPEYDEELIVEDTVTMVIQVNGKVRDRIDVAADVSEADAVELALASERVQAFLDGAEVRKVIARPPKIVNVVV